jgi:transposase
MRDVNLFCKKVLDIGTEWIVESVSVDEKRKRVDILINYDLKEGPCVDTGELCKVYDRRQEREWRHLDCLGYTTYLHSRLPRIKDGNDDIKTMAIGWAEPGASHTLHFENRSITTLQATHSRLSASHLMSTSDDMICGIMYSAVSRGLARRDLDKTPVRQLCIDEKSVGKGHRYMSILSDGQTGAVLEAAEGRDIKSVAALIDKTFTARQLEGIQEVCCDMWEAYMTTLKKSVRMPNWFMINSMLFDSSRMQ